MHDDWFPLEELTTRLGSLVWVEQAVAEVVAGWSGIEGDAAAAVAFAIAAGHHAWHAEVVRGCLATSPDLVADDPVQPPTAGWQEAVAALRSLDDREATGVRLNALCRVIDPWFEREIDVLAELSNPVSDAGSLRWLRFVALDHHQDGSAISELAEQRTDGVVQLRDHQVIQRVTAAVATQPGGQD